MKSAERAVPRSRSQKAKALDDFRYRVKRIWRAWLSRRSQTAFIAWDRFALLEARYPLPPARLAHPLRVR